MNKRLIAVQRMDKNGRVVTRHVRPEDTGAARQALPSPSISKAPSEALVDSRAIVDLLHSKDDYGNLLKYNGDYQNIPLETLAHTMSETFTPRSVGIAARLLSESRNTTNMYLIAGILNCAERPLDAPLDDGIRRIVETQIEEAQILSVAGLNRSSMVEAEPMTREASYVKKLANNQAQQMMVEWTRQGIQLPETEDERWSKQCEMEVALLMTNIASTTSAAELIKDPNSYEHLNAVYEARDKILPYLNEMRKRGSIDLNLVTELSEAPTQALREGTL